MAKSKAGYWLTDEKLALLTEWARDGLKDNEIFEKMEIGKTTFYDYLNKYSNFSNAIKKGREERHRILAQKAEDAVSILLDYHEEVVEQVDEWTEGEVTKVHKRKTKRMLPPDASITIFTMKAQGKWTDKSEAELDFIKARTEELQGGDNREVESLKPLAEMLKL